LTRKYAHTLLDELQMHEKKRDAREEKGAAENADARLFYRR
jgi:hypothetical protein